MICNRVSHLIMTDDSYKQSDEDLILSGYTHADKGEKEIVNNIFIALCGVSLETILNEDYQKDIEEG